MGEKNLCDSDWANIYIKHKSMTHKVKDTDKLDFSKFKT